MHKIILLSSLVALSAQAQDVTPVLTNLAAPDAPAPAVVCAPSADRNFSACITSVCGAEDKNETYKDLFNRLGTSAHKSDAALARIKALINSNYREDNAASLDQLKKARALVVQDKMAINPEVANIHKIMYLMSVASGIDLSACSEVNEKADGSFSFTIKTDQLHQQLVGKMGEKTSVVEGPLREMLEDPGYQNVMIAASIGWPLLLEGQYPGKTMKETMTTQSEEIRSVKQDLVTQSAFLNDVVASLDLDKRATLEKIEAEPNPSSQELDSYFSSGQISKLVYRFLLHPPAKFAAWTPTSMTDFLPKAQLLKAIDGDIKDRSSKSDLSSSVKQLQDHCEAIYLKSQDADPSDEERQNFYAVIEAEKAQFKQKILSKFSPESAAAMGPKIDAIKFNIPISKEKMASLLETNISHILAQTRQQQALNNSYAKDPKGADLNLISAQSVISFDDEDASSEDDTSAEDVTYACDDFEVPSLEDHDMPLGSNEIMLSWLTLKRPDVGAGILAHEMGHSLSDFIRTGTISAHSAGIFKGARMCLNEGYPAMGMAFESVNGEGYQVNQFTEENWADVVAGKYALPTDKNKVCFLVSKDSRGKYDEKILMPAADEKDTHSPNMFRLLRINSMMGKELSSECASLLAPEEIALVKKDCLP